MRREDFPILDSGIIYFDNAATTHKPLQVIEAVREFYMRHNSNVHRGIHRLSREASELYEEAHEVLARFINARACEVVFTHNTTDAINMVAIGWALPRLRPGDNVVTTVMEHHSNILPWKFVCELKGAELRYVDVNEEGLPSPEQLEELVDRNTKLVAVSGMSNVTGAIPEVREFIKVAHDNGAVILVDGAQMVPHMPVNVKELDVDFLAFSGHKMLGPTGTGVLYGKEELLEEMLPPKPGGGTITDVTLEGVEWAPLPWRHEGGTPNIAGAVGLAEAAKYLMNVGMERVREHEKELVAKALKVLDEVGAIVYGPRDVDRRGGIATFNFKGLEPHMVGALLDARKIAVRTGLHCAHPLHRRIKARNGTVRASFYLYNTLKEIEAFKEALEEISKLV